MQIIVLLALFGLMYVMLIRPQQQRARRQRELIMSVEVGDRVLTVGGMLGTIVGLADDTVDVEVADGVVLRFVRAAISRTVPDEDQAASGDDDGAVDLTDQERTDPPELGA